MNDSRLPPLIRHKKKLLGPISLMEIKANFPFSKTSWADLGFYEYFWLGLFLSRVEFKDAITFCINLGNSIGAKEDNLKEAGAHWSYIHKMRHKVFPAAPERYSQEISIEAWEAISAQTLINTYNKGYIKISEIDYDFSFVRKICDKEHPFALKTMYLYFITLIYAGRLKMPYEMFSKLDPYSLDNYPESVASLSSAGMLRAYTNTNHLINNKENSLSPLPLWTFLCQRSDCK